MLRETLISVSDVIPILLSVIVFAKDVSNGSRNILMLSIAFAANGGFLLTTLIGKRRGRDIVSVILAAALMCALIIARKPFRSTVNFSLLESKMKSVLVWIRRDTSFIGISSDVSVI